METARKREEEEEKKREKEEGRKRERERQRNEKRRSRKRKWKIKWASQRPRAYRHKLESVKDMEAVHSFPQSILIPSPDSFLQNWVRRGKVAKMSVSKTTSDKGATEHTLAQQNVCVSAETRQSFINDVFKAVEAWESQSLSQGDPPLSFDFELMDLL